MELKDSQKLYRLPYAKVQNTILEISVVLLEYEVGKRSNEDIQNLAYGKVKLALMKSGHLDIVSEEFVNEMVAEILKLIE